ncbi:M23 family metallopeptidase [Crocinitomix catalasitica]|uniref:M23 family metallopeptidase n=1 Tax=Crocinitomix catalasitica TaxID=184607 RepID=UPI000486AAC5|nr:M23 family metallopeptidase [Crocinitomix catalasitica]
MRKQKFRYNPESLSYEKVQLTWKERILRSILFIAPSIVVGFGFYLLFTQLLQSPRELKLERENAFLTAQVENMHENVILMSAVVEDLEHRDNEIYRVVFNAEPFPEQLRELGTGGSDKYNKLKGFDNSKRVIENSKLIEALQKRIYAQSISFDEVIKLAKEKEAMLGAMPAIQPVSNEDLRRIASGYGWRIDPIYKTKKMHWGLDFTAETGTNIYATGNGVVKIVESKKWGYGNSIVIDHGFGYTSRYAHMSAFDVKEGDRVVRGQIIGKVGSTGKSTAPHLHYEVEKNGKKIDPVHFFHSDISPDQYEKLLEMANNANQSFD